MEHQIESAAANLSHAGDQLGFGVCVRDQNMHVLAQNKLCIALCGHQQGRTCAFRGFYPCSNPAMQTAAAAGTYRFPQVRAKGRILDLLVINTGHNVVTIQCPTAIPQLAPYLHEDKLTSRELAVLGMQVSGMERPEIAQELGVSVNTVKTHLKRINQKLSPSSQAFVAALLGLRRH